MSLPADRPPQATVADLTTPSLYPQKADAAGKAYFFIPLTREQYRAASFLDDRVLAPGVAGQWISRALVEAALAKGIERRPLHFLFHIGHCGSTLLSRLLDDTERVLGLREPLPLRDVAERFDAQAATPAGGGSANAALDLLLRLWERGYPETDCVVVKATSSTARLHPQLMAARPESRAAYLGQAAESQLATLLAGSGGDLAGFAQERRMRLQRLLEAPPPAVRGPGELAAMSWLTEMLTRRTALTAHGERLLALDFDDFLKDPRAGLERVVRHFGLTVDSERLDLIARGPTLLRYSKAPDYVYSAGRRAQILARSRIENALQFRAGLRWLERLGRSHPAVGELLDESLE